MQPSAEWIIERLALKPHPTCGFMSETFVSDLQIPAASLPKGYGGRGRWAECCIFSLRLRQEFACIVSAPIRCIIIIWAIRWKCCSCIRVAPVKRKSWGPICWMACVRNY